MPSGQRLAAALARHGRQGCGVGKSFLAARLAHLQPPDRAARVMVLPPRLRLQGIDQLLADAAQAQLDGKGQRRNDHGGIEEAISQLVGDIGPGGFLHAARRPDLPRRNSRIPAPRWRARNRSGAGIRCAAWCRRAGFSEPRLRSWLALPLLGFVLARQSPPRPGPACGFRSSPSSAASDRLPVPSSCGFSSGSPWRVRSAGARPAAPWRRPIRFRHGGSV